MKPLPEFLKEFEKYVRDVRALHERGRAEGRRLESAKMKTFFSFLERVAGLRPEEYSYDAFVVKGSRPDAVTGNVVVEFEDDLSQASEVREAEAQLKRYLGELGQRDPARRFWAVASDGLRFVLYKPSARGGEVELRRVDEIDVLRDDPRRFYWFIYEYFFEERFRTELRPESFVLRFGYGSRVFRETMELLRSLWRRVASTALATTIFSEWSKYYTYVTGRECRDVELFLRHTYLATLAKILTYIYLEGAEARLGDVETLERVLTGEYFRSMGLEIFERDYFSWVVANEIKGDFLWGLHDTMLRELLSFDYSRLDTDVFKEIYQNIIEHDERAALGEYYTPDFVAELMLRDLLSRNPQARVLDPACGSGTFLFTAIKLKKELLGGRLSRQELLEHILSSVVGIDINPVAVVIARANYLIALRDLLPARGVVRVPVYLANAVTIPEHETDTLLVPELGRSVEVLRIGGAGEGEHFLLPGRGLAEKLGVEGLDLLISMAEDAARLLAEAGSGEGLARELVDRYAARLGRGLTEGERLALAHILLHNARTLHRYLSENRDTFWLFVLRNQYRVFLLREQFDVVVGNPPWVSRTDVESEKFRRWYDGVLRFYRVSLKQELLGAPADTVIPFVLHCVNYYLRPGGYLYFVVPASVLQGYQYEVLRREPGPLRIHRIVSLERLRIRNVSRNRTETVFSVPCILLLARKGVERGGEGIEGAVYEGTVVHSSRNAPLAALSEALRSGSVRVVEGRYVRRGPASALVFEQRGEGRAVEGQRLVEKLVALSGSRRSAYLDRAVAGVGAYPRSFVLVRIPRPRYGLDPERIYVETHPRAITRGSEGAGKERWRRVLRGRVPYRYLYILVTGDSVFPFGVWGVSVGVLPVAVDYESNRFLVLSAERALVELGEWYWGGVGGLYREEGRAVGRQDVLNFISWLLRERINYQNKLGRQRPRAYTLVYNCSGDALNMGSAVIDRLQLLDRANRFLRKALGLDGDDLQLVSGVVIDYTNYLIDFESEEEAHYLCAMLQSSVVRQAVNRIQPPRHITDRPLQLPIPELVTDERVPALKSRGLPEGDIEELRRCQLELASISKQLHHDVERLLESLVYGKHGVPLVNITDSALTPQSVAAVRRAVRQSIAEQQSRIDELAAKVIDLALRSGSAARTILHYARLRG